MALDFSTLTPEDSEITFDRSPGRTSESNPFVDNGWLKKAFNSPKQISVPAGDAAKVSNLLHTAANRENLGVTVQVFVDKVRFEQWMRGVAIIADGGVPENWEEADVKEGKRLAKRTAVIKYASKARRPRKTKEQKTPEETPAE